MFYLLHDNDNPWNYTGAQIPSPDIFFNPASQATTGLYLYHSLSYMRPPVPALNDVKKIKNKHKFYITPTIHSS